MNMSQQPDSFEPGDYLAVLRRRWWIVLVMALAGLLVAGAYVKTAPKVYTATASVQVSANAANSTQVSGGRTGGGAVDMDSQAQVVQSASVAALAVKSLRTDLTAAQLSKKISVTVPANSEVLQIGCSLPSADAAAACAEAFAKAYLSSQTTAASSQLTATLNTLNNQVIDLTNEVAKLGVKIDALPLKSTQRRSTQAQQRSDNAQLGSLSRQQGVVKAEQANVSPGSILSNAEPPASPT